MQHPHLLDVAEDNDLFNPESQMLKEKKPTQTPRTLHLMSTSLNVVNMAQVF